MRTETVKNVEVCPHCHRAIKKSVVIKIRCDYCNKETEEEKKYLHITAYSKYESENEPPYKLDFCSWNCFAEYMAEQKNDSIDFLEITSSFYPEWNDNETTISAVSDLLKIIKESEKK